MSDLHLTVSSVPFCHTVALNWTVVVLFGSVSAVQHRFSTAFVGVAQSVFDPPPGGEVQVKSPVEPGIRADLICSESLICSWSTC